MQLSTMRDEARKIFNETDVANTHISEAELTAWANEFYRLAQLKLGDIPITERTYTAAATITLNSNSLRIDDIYLFVMPGSKYRQLDIIDMATLSSIDPEWPSAAVDVPQYFVRTGTFEAKLYPPPNAANAGQNLKAIGMEFKTALSGDTDTPDLPLNIHDIFPHFMAYRSFQKLQDQERAVSELISVNSQLKTQQNATVGFSKQRKRWLWND